MQKIMYFLLSVFFSATAFAVPINTENKALEVVINSIKRNQLTPLTTDCLLFVFAEQLEHSRYYEIEVREKHNEVCGGEPQIAPRLFSYQVDKKTGKLKTDSIQLNLREGTEWDGSFKPIK